jgi:hypothetical protein
MKKYSTGEVITMLELNPKLEFRCVKGNTGEYETISVNHGRMCWGGDNRYPLFIVVEKPLEWELIQQPIPFMEAVKAYSEGKAIRCEWNGGYKEYLPCGLKCVNTTFAANDILNGKWYIKEEPNE